MPVQTSAGLWFAVQMDRARDAFTRIQSAIQGNQGRGHYFLAPHVLPEEQDAIAMVQLAVEAVAHPQDGAIDHDFDMLGQLTRLRIPEGILQLWKTFAQPS